MIIIIYKTLYFFDGGELLISFMAFIIPKQASLIKHFWSDILNEDEDAIKNILTKFQCLQNQPVQILTFYWKKKKKSWSSK